MRGQFLGAALGILAFLVMAYFIVQGFIIPAAQGAFKLLGR